VDDEKRVLNSMRIMFRREYEMHLANSGAEALQILDSNEIDVIVADHRMPQMTGVQLLGEVRRRSPRTVRILLTGYADLDAVEGSINDGEVFRFLTKPCAPDQLRETLALAAKVAHHTATIAATPASAKGDSAAAAAQPAVRGSATAEPVKRTDTQIAATRQRLAQGLAVLVFSNDEEVLVTVQQCVAGRLPVYRATNIVQVVKVLNEQRPGVLITDISEDKATLQSMTAQLKEHLPELVTIAVSQHRDVLDMVWLINHGQIFRFLRKPLSPGRSAVCLQAALKHHRMLLKNPDLVRRHEVAETDSGGLVDGMLAKLRLVRRLWASA
jgi:serine/threonine-protein kinase